MTREHHGVLGQSYNQFGMEFSEVVAQTVAENELDNVVAILIFTKTKKF